MQIYLHHTAGDVIDLDDATGQWRPVAEHNHVSPAELSIAWRHGYPIRGSYTIEDGNRYSLYWTAAKILVLRTPDGKRYELFRNVGDEKFVDLSGIRVQIRESTLPDGRANPGFSDVAVIDKQGNVLHTLTYYSKRYLDLYLHDFTANTDRDLSDWDFFVALQRGIEEMAAKSA